MRGGAGDGYFFKEATVCGGGEWRATITGVQNKHGTVYSPHAAVPKLKTDGRQPTKHKTQI